MLRKLTRRRQLQAKVIFLAYEQRERDTAGVREMEFPQLWAFNTHNWPATELSIGKIVMQGTAKSGEDFYLCILWEIYNCKFVKSPRGIMKLVVFNQSVDSSGIKIRRISLVQFSYDKAPGNWWTVHNYYVFCREISFNKWFFFFFLFKLYMLLRIFVQYHIFRNVTLQISKPNLWHMYILTRTTFCTFHIIFHTMCIVCFFFFSFCNIKLYI